MDYFEAVGRGCATEITLFEHSAGKSARCGFTNYGRAIDTTTNDNYIELPVTKLFQITLHGQYSSSEAKANSIKINVLIIVGAMQYK
jgi:hypothetical protein